MRPSYWPMLLLVGCREPSVAPVDRTSRAVETAPVPETPEPTSAPLPASANPQATSRPSEAPQATSVPGAQDLTPPEIVKVPVGGPNEPLRSLCFVQGDCLGGGNLTPSALVELNLTDGVSCEEKAVPKICPKLSGTIPIAEDAGFSPICAIAAHMPKDLPHGDAGRPREAARADLMKVVAKGAPCRDDPPGARMAYRYWCDTYRANGTILSRQYFGQVAHGTEHSWFQDFDEHGKVVQEFTDCDGGHN